MTNKERLLSLLGFTPSDVNSLEGTLLDNGITGAGTYDSSLSIPIKRCAIEVMELLLTTANISDSTPGFSVTYDRNAVLQRMKLLKQEIGLVDETLPTITGKNVW